MVLMDNRELGFDSGELAWEMANTSKEGSRRVNYSYVDTDEVVTTNTNALPPFTGRRQLEWAQCKEVCE